VVGAIDHALKTESLAGPVNAVSPQSATNSAFTHVLGKVLRRPTIFPLPSFAARVALGEMAEELLLASTRVTPAALQQSGYTFQFPDLDGALRHLLDKNQN
jgi:NAD dependent epimerase/dehydratase family enzyme